MRKASGAFQFVAFLCGKGRSLVGRGNKAIGGFCIAQCLEYGTAIGLEGDFLVRRSTVDFRFDPAEVEKGRSDPSCESADQRVFVKEVAGTEGQKTKNAGKRQSRKARAGCCGQLGIASSQFGSGCKHVWAMGPS